MKVHVDSSFPDEEKLIQMADDLSIPPAHAAGLMQFLWCRVMNKPGHREDGNMRGWTPLVIARAAGWLGDAQKFVDAAIHCGRPVKEGLIHEKDGVLYLHEWQKWQGPLLNKLEYEAKKRQEERERKQLAATAAPASGAKGDNSAVKLLLDRMRECHIVGTPAQKREHAEAWLSRGIAEKAEQLIMGDGKGKGIFWIGKALDGNGKPGQETAEEAGRRIAQEAKRRMGMA